jgi:hypothetical protein
MKTVLNKPIKSRFATQLSQIGQLIVYTMCIHTTGCMNHVDVPASISTTQCLQDSKGKCTTNLEVRHVIAIELPTVLTDNCAKIWNETDFPDKAVREAGYNKCVSDYIDSLLNLIKGITPADLPQ